MPDMSEWRCLGDWGSSRLRLWRRADGDINDRRDGPGIVGLAIPPAQALLETMAPWRAQGQPSRLTFCGMAGARGGLHETVYAPCPLTAADWQQRTERLMLDGMQIRIAAGCAYGIKDVMRGEETQLFGALALWPELGEGRRLVILPGTHSKWVWLEHRAIASFATMLTGEIFALLQSSSLLPTREPGSAAEDAGGFASGIARAKASPGILGKLFDARAGQLREDRSADWARSYLSGLLIAGEIMEMRATISMPQQITLIGDAALCDRYTRALTAFDLDSTTLDGEASVLAGLELLDAID